MLYNPFNPKSRGISGAIAHVAEMAQWVRDWDFCDYDTVRSKWIGHATSTHCFPNGAIDYDCFYEMWGNDDDEDMRRDEDPPAAYWLGSSPRQTPGRRPGDS